MNTKLILLKNLVAIIPTSADSTTIRPVRVGARLPLKRRRVAHDCGMASREEAEMWANSKHMYGATWILLLCTPRKVIVT